uniref:Transposase n=1 Tax=Heterorhabditis bacteriophora TaxID=37862 RepID=A0A1I7WLR9_HETBA
MIWPSRSPDRNPMKNFWAILVCQIYANNRQLEITKALQLAISKEWSEVINSSGSCTDH